MVDCAQNILGQNGRLFFQTDLLKCYFDLDVIEICLCGPDGPYKNITISNVDQDRYDASMN